MGTLSLMAEAAHWQDTSECNKDIVDRFTEYVNTDAQLSAHRDYIEKHVYGFGERCFLWMWKLIVDDMPSTFRFLEIGVYKGQVPSLIRLLATRTERQVNIIGVTPLSSFAGTTNEFPDYPDDDYRQHIQDLHDHFDQSMPRLYQGDSNDPKIQRKIKALKSFDIVYIDGCHELNFVTEDILCYGACLKEGGLLVMDDASSYMAPVWGHCQGIEQVSAAVRAIIETDVAWEHLLAVMHNRVWRKVGPTGIEMRELASIQEYAWVGGPGGNVAVKV